MDVPSYDDIKSGAAINEVLPATSPALVGWAQVFGGRAGDEVEITLTDPVGRAFHSHTAMLENPQARLFRAAGRKAPDGGWMQGDWVVRARLLRDGTLLDEMNATIRVGK